MKFRPFAAKRKATVRARHLYSKRNNWEVTLPTGAIIFTHVQAGWCHLSPQVMCPRSKSFCERNKVRYFIDNVVKVTRFVLKDFIG